MSIPTVTYERVKAIIDKQELKYIVDENDNEIGIGFEDILVWVNINERVMRMYGVLRGQCTTPAIANELTHYANHLNKTHLLPKVITRGQGNETEPTKLIFESNLPIECGLNDTQLNNFFDMTMGSFFNTIEKVQEAYPQYKEQESRENEA